VGNEITMIKYDFSIGFCIGLIVTCIVIYSCVSYAKNTTFISQEEYLSLLDKYSTTNNSIIKINNYTYYVFEDLFKQQLKDNYNKFTDKEYAACIDIEDKQVKTNETIINNYDFKGVTNLVEGSKNYSPAVNCNLGRIHLHTNGCENTLWSGDVAAAQESFKSGNLFFVIQCDTNKLEIFTRENLYEGVVVKIQ
jgi:hypothetical protein